MSEQWSAPAWVVVALAALLVVDLLVVGVALMRSRRRARAHVADLTVQNTALTERVEALEQQASRTPAPRRTEDAREYVITDLGDDTSDPDVESAPVVPAPVFADLVLRETVAQTAMLVAGLRRALSAETRNRIRFEMRRELKRARKQRRADTRTARREWEARQRAAQQGQEHAA